MRELLTGQHTKLTVPELYSSMFPGAGSPGKILEEFRRISDEDGVHLTEEGYAKWSNAVMATFAQSDGTSIPTNNEQKTYFWRGFVSPHGAERPKNQAALHLHRIPVAGRKAGADNIRSHNPARGHGAARGAVRGSVRGGRGSGSGKSYGSYSSKRNHQHKPY